MTRHQGPGVEWLARRTGNNPSELTASPAASVALAHAARELTELAARMESSDRATREAVQAEADDLRRQIAAAPSPSETFGKRVGEILRHAAERLDENKGRVQ